MEENAQADQTLKVTLIIHNIAKNFIEDEK